MNTENGRFFIVVPPGLEKAALYELHRFYLDVFQATLTEYQQFPGGIEVELPYAKGFQLNYLKIPVRILLRIATRMVEFEEDFSKFVKEQSLDFIGTYRKIYVSSKTSALRHKEGLESLFKKSAKIKAHQTGSDIYLRFFRDQCTLSVDTSGDDLYMRGLEKWTGEAPMRDNLAAGILQVATQGISDFKEWNLIDPVVGSGTFLIEALNMDKPSSRKFAFERWKIPGLKVETSKSLPSFAQPFHQFYGFDIEAKVIAMTEKNINSLKVKNVTLAQRDAFKKENPLNIDGKKLVIMNPPYGIRLKIDPRSYFPNLLDAVSVWTQADRIGIVVPRGVILGHADYEMVRSLDLLNGGIEIFFYLFVRKQLPKAT